MNGGHETLEDPPVGVEHLGDGSETVGGARSVRNDVLRGLVVLVVHTEHVGGRSVLSRSRKDDLLRTSLQVARRLLLAQESSGRLAHDVSTELAPLQVVGVLLVGQVHLVSVYFYYVLAYFLNCSREPQVSRVVLQLVN